MFNLTTDQLLAQGVTAIIILLSVINGQSKKQSRLIFIQMICCLLFTLQHYLTGAVTALYISLVCAGRNLLFLFYKKKDGEVPLWALLGVCAATIVISLVTWQNGISIIPMLGPVIFTYGIWQKNLKITKITSILSLLLWIFHELYYMAILSAIYAVMEIVSILIWFTRGAKEE